MCFKVQEKCGFRRAEPAAGRKFFCSRLARRDVGDKAGNRSARSRVAPASSSFGHWCEGICLSARGAAGQGLAFRPDAARAFWLRLTCRPCPCPCLRLCLRFRRGGAWCRPADRWPGRIPMTPPPRRPIVPAAVRARRICEVALARACFLVFGGHVTSFAQLCATPEMGVAGPQASSAGAEWPQRRFRTRNQCAARRLGFFSRRSERARALRANRRIDEIPCRARVEPQARRATLRRRCDRAVHARREPGEMASRAYQLVLREP